MRRIAEMIAAGVVLSAVFTLSLPGSAAAAEPAGYRCEFASGQVFVYDKGVFRPDSVKPMAILFGSIDRARQTAVMESSGGALPVRIVLAVNAIHVLEVAGEGFLNVTTIYDKDETSGSHPAVHSRHFGVLGQAVVSQYQGRCSPR